MFQKLVACGVFAGLAAGLIAAALQIFFVVPILLEAERYESGELIHFAGGAEVGADSAAHDRGAHDHGSGASAETGQAAQGQSGSDHGEDGSNLLRHVLTVLATVAAFCGFGLLLTAGFALAERRGYQPDGRAGLLWGVGGFVAVQLAPAAGLPPELPGSTVGDLVLRQAWWFSTVLLTGTGIWFIAFAKHWVPWTLGAILVFVPHLFAAPHPNVFGGVAPPELASAFAARSLAVGFASWVILGLITGYVWQKNPFGDDT
ncbi:MAG: CbtA family protein [Paracoccaceae bacterium]